ncbi:nucleoporin Nup120/160-domain-containing protein [Cyathus striatus]|nr:nucleoporin Nup120/160-domain-containing protein [Cyathus striatus]
MEEYFLIATQLSSLNTLPPTSIPIQTSRQKIPLPPDPSDSDPHVEHATYSCVLNTPTTGTVLLRLVHGGVIIELSSLSSQIIPLRFVFPAVIATAPAIFLWDNSEIHVIAVTNTGSLYRLVVPVRARNLWHNQIEGIWPREYLIKSFSEDSILGLVHVQGTHSVAISMPNGSLLRLDADFGYDGNEEEWTETIFQCSSFLSSLTSFLPSLSNGTPNASYIISMATHPWPTDIGYVWSLSRDRTLRFWKPKIGCVASKVLSPLLINHESSPISANSAGKHQVLLDGAPQRLLRVFSTSAHEDHLYVVVFLPTASSSSSGGVFHLVDTHGDQLYELGMIECSKNSTYCHLQDFMVSNNTLYSLWDKQGRSTVERITFHVDNWNDSGYHPNPWLIASYAQEQELTPAYMEEQLLGSGSLTEKFLEAIMKPGVFSTLTLRLALEQYTDACLSLPGPPPPPLTAIYASLSDNIAAVVGCTVTLNRDPHTGALQYANYWTALRRDWEGFVARCREIERSARWPLVLGSQGDDDIIMIERERVGSVVKEDLPISLRRVIVHDRPLNPQYNLLQITWFLRTKLGPQVMSNLESRIVDIMHQEIAFSFADILQDQAQRSQLKECLDEGSTSWLLGRLQSIQDLDAATRVTLDVIGGCDMEVKREEEEVELLLPSSSSEWSHGLVASYVAVTVEARYDLCLSLITLLFFLSDDLNSWDPSLLAEVFALFRGIAMLKFVSGQPAGESDRNLEGDLSTDDVVSRMQNMHFSSTKSQVTPKVSLMHRLLSQSGDANVLPAAAHRFLDSCGLLQSISPSYATKYEVLYCERIRLLGFLHVARELLSWLPRTPGATYVLSQVWLNLRRADDASRLLEKLAGCFGENAALTPEDRNTLTMVLPATQLFDSQFHFYRWAAELFKNLSTAYYEVLFSKLAISVAPTVSEASSLWINVVKGYTEQQQYDDAYAALMTMAKDKQSMDCACQLAIKMCEDDAVERLVAFDFGDIADEVEGALSFKARNVDPRLHPSYSRILYAWYIQRGDYRNASLTMYQRARKLQGVVTDGASFVELVYQQLDSLSIAINALALVDEKTAWILMPVSPDIAQESLKQYKLSKHIPESMYTMGKYDAEIIHIADMRYDYTLLHAQINSIQRDPSLLSSTEFMLPPSLIVLRLTQTNQFNSAISISRSLKLDMTELFIQLTLQCIRLARDSDTVLQEDTSDWLLTNKVSSWPGTPADRGWRFLRQSLERNDNLETDYKYSKVTLDTILGVESMTSPPPWLINILEEHQPEYLVRVSLRYENLEAAVSYALNLIRKSDARLSRESTRNASVTWLPYSLLDQVLIAASTHDKPPPRLSELRSEISSRVRRVQKYTQTH